MTEKKEYLIVGAGLSGICMAIHLIKNNHSIKVDLWELYNKYHFFSNETFLF